MTPRPQLPSSPPSDFGFSQRDTLGIMHATQLSTTERGPDPSPHVLVHGNLACKYAAFGYASVCWSGRFCELFHARHRASAHSSSRLGFQCSEGCPAPAEDGEDRSFCLSCAAWHPYDRGIQACEGVMAGSIDYRLSTPVLSIGRAQPARSPASNMLENIVQVAGPIEHRCADVRSRLLQLL